MFNISLFEIKEMKHLAAYCYFWHGDNYSSESGKSDLPFTYFDAKYVVYKLQIQ